MAIHIGATHLKMNTTTPATPDLRTPRLLICY